MTGAHADARLPGAMMRPSILVTGSSGYIGRLLVAELAEGVRAGRFGTVVAADIRAPEALPDGVRFVRHDVRDAGLEAVMQAHGTTVVVHLASIVTPPRGSTRDVEYAVDVGGTRRVLEGCVAARVRRIVVTSSGAAYGYHADNPARLRETDPLRGNESFAYAWHKRLVEEMLATYRRDHPALEQVVFRVGTILGATVSNQITALFEKRRLLAVSGSASPFVFVHDRDVVRCLVRGVDTPVTGIFNVAGDGVVTIDEIATLLHKPVLRIPPWLLRGALAVLAPLGLTRYGPAQVAFLRYRPVLDNTRLKEVFGYRPAMTSREAFMAWRDAAPRVTAPP